MNRTFSSLCLWMSLAATAAWSGCAAEPPVEVAPSAGASGQTTNASGASGSAGAFGSSGVAGASSISSAGAPQPGGTGGLGNGGLNPNGGDSASGSSGAGGAAPVAGAAGAPGAGSPSIPPGCDVSTPVSFKSDIGPFLAESCGKGKGGGCHVTDSESTANSLCPDGTQKCGFNHAYDWITAGSHNQYCKQTPGPIRYTVVMAVLESANPPSCSKTRVMPPDGPPLTQCQKAALAAWLAEPKVLQVHRADDTSPTEPYLMPPFN